MPQISIILPVYNAERYINRTITSILQQTYTDFELIAIDDCSTDSSLQKLKEWETKDRRIKVLTNTHNLGVADTRNKGTATAKGMYICFIDSDDTWHSDKLAQQLEWMQRTGSDFSCTEYDMVDDEGRFIKHRSVYTQAIQYDDLLKENYIICSSVMIKTDLAKQHSMNGTYVHEDYIYWLDLLKTGARGTVLQENMTQYRLAQTGRSANKLNAAKGRWQIYRKYLKFNIVKTVWYFVHYAVNGVKKYS